MNLISLGKKNSEIEIGGRKLILSTNGFASQADAAVVAQYGETMILATVVCGGCREDLGYFPLQVEYVERLYAGGRIKGSRWVKREGRPSDEAVLIARLVDRAIRPLFPEGYFNEIQIVLILLSVDQQNDPAFVSAVATSAALQISSIPWKGPIGLVKVGLKDDQPFINPLTSEEAFSDLDLTVAVSSQGVVMLEAGANQVPEEKFLKAILFGKKEGEKILQFIQDFGEKFGKEKQPFLSIYPSSEELKAINSLLGSKIKKMVNSQKGSQENDLLLTIIQEAKDALGSQIKPSLIDLGVRELVKKAVREKILTGERVDGRKAEELRPVSAKVGVLARTHGSALFTRGETQVMTVTTLGAPSLKQLIESAEGEETKRYIHHYFMPGYSMGEISRFGWPGRREIGHGALAERALLAVIPSEEKFPYTIRVVSEVLSSNGSTSMASVCGSSLSLMDAGVPIVSPVAGISIGLIKEGEKYQLLTDIAGIEDFYGDMDFKVAGTEKGITAVQVDTKIGGLNEEIIKEALTKAQEARKEILKIIRAVIPAPREKISQWAPKIAVLHISPSVIGELIGPGGRMIRKIIEETSCEINIEDDGTVSIVGLNQELVDEAVKRIKAITQLIKPGDLFTGVVKRIQPFGVFVEFLPEKEGLIHISDLADGFVKNPVELVKVGQKIKVVVKEIDEMGRVNLRPQIPFRLESRRIKPWLSPKHSWMETKFASRLAKKRRS